MNAPKFRLEHMKVILFRDCNYPIGDIERQLRDCGVRASIADSAQVSLEKLRCSAEPCDVFIILIGTRWQRALDLVRQVRRMREQMGGCPLPIILILSTLDQYGVTVELLMRTAGTKYRRFASTEDIVAALNELGSDIRQIKRRQPLHIRLVHRGNRFVEGCISGEYVVAAYGSFGTGHEEPINASQKVLQFLNLFAMNHWRYRTASEIVQLMKSSPFYTNQQTGSTAIISVNSVKTYVLRLENVLAALSLRQIDAKERPRFVLRERRGAKEVAYKLAATVEIDHI